MSPPDLPTEDEKLEAALASPLFVDAFLTALQADENDEAVYGWMAEEARLPCGYLVPGDSPAHTADARSVSYPDASKKDAVDG